MVMAAVIIAATAAIAMGPLVNVVKAAPNGDVRCVHNGNGQDRCTPYSWQQFHFESKNIGKTS